MQTAIGIHIGKNSNSLVQLDQKRHLIHASHDEKLERLINSRSFQSQPVNISIGYDLLTIKTLYSKQTMSQRVWQHSIQQLIDRKQNYYQQHTYTDGQNGQRITVIAIKKADIHRWYRILRSRQCKPRHMEADISSLTTLLPSESQQAILHRYGNHWLLHHYQQKRYLYGQILTDINTLTLNPNISLWITENVDHVAHSQTRPLHSLNIKHPEARIEAYAAALRGLL